jgi:hypothetical protein
MKLTIDNLQGQGPQDYTGALDGTKIPKIERKLNQPAELQFSLLANGPEFVIPLTDARVTLGKNEWERCLYGIRDRRSAVRISGLGRARSSVSL